MLQWGGNIAHILEVSPVDFKLFAKLSGLSAASGREEILAEEIVKIIKPLVTKVDIDALGNIIAFKKGAGRNNKKIMLAAHMDEVALRVKYIDDAGFLRFINTGGIDPRTLLAQRVNIQTERHGAITGVIGVKAAHYLTAADKAAGAGIDSLFIDIGYDAKKAKEIVSIGDPVTLDRAPVEFGDNLFSAKAIDDRAGVCILLEVLKKLPKKHAADLYFVFTAQEEYGLIGAQVSSFAVKPDMALAIDTTGALDMPGIPPQDHVLKMGKGIGITLVDARAIAHGGMVKLLKEICAKKKIAYQLRVSSKGGNDSSAMQKSRGGN
jgi:endoglucanase